MLRILPEAMHVQRYWLRIWNEDGGPSAEPVFSAWCALSHAGHEEGLVVTDRPGTWEEYLRTRLILEVAP